MEVQRFELGGYAIEGYVTNWTMQREHRNNFWNDHDSQTMFLSPVERMTAVVNIEITSIQELGGKTKPIAEATPEEIQKVRRMFLE